jgi:DNA-binding FrmR family transcriptional regulator
MKLESAEAKQKLVNRLRRIEGQVHGIQVMLAEERDSREIVQQFTAVRSAIHNVSLIFFEEYASTCLENMEGEEREARQQILQDLIKLLEKAP